MSPLPNLAGGGPCRCGHRAGWGEGGEQGAGAHHGGTAEAGLLEEAQPGVAGLEGFGGLMCGFTYRAICVQVLESYLGFHWCSP